MLLQVALFHSFFKNKFIYLFLAALGLCCCVWVFSPSAASGGYSSVAVCGLLIVVASLCCGARAVDAWASVVVARGLSSCGSQVLERRLSSCGARA